MAEALVTARIKREVFGKPVAQPRTRSSARGYRRAHFTPDPKGEGKAWKRAVREAFEDVAKPFAASAPVRVALTLFMPRPLDHHVARDRSRDLKPEAPTMHVTKPDADNLAKAVLDALNGVLWTDDAQVCDLRVIKRYGSEAGATIEVRRINE